MNQERGAPVQIGTHDIDAALGFVPILDDHVFQLFVQKIFSGFFVGRIHFDEIGQHAARDGILRLGPARWP